MKAILMVLLLLVIPVGVNAHPGRLDKDGCHHVRKDFIYKSGKVAPKGEYHCHRLLGGHGGTILDGREVLMDDRRDIERDQEEELEVQSP